jgi:hypothetical protein
MIDRHLPGPPSYDYPSLGPWMVSHVDSDGRGKARILHTLMMAVQLFWSDPDNGERPLRRTVVDVRGNAILAISRDHDGEPLMSGTRESMDVCLALAARELSEEAQMEVLIMADTLASMDGQAM